MRGVLHLHSTYSDGEFSLAELRTLFLQAGCRFLCMTDHAEAFDEKKLQDYREECASLSDSKLIVVAGLEYRCERNMHILGYGATRPSQSNDPQTVIRHIEVQNAVSVIAHPKEDCFPWIESFEVLPRGVEAWNSKYDGRYAPRPATFSLVRRLQSRKADLHAFYGQDLHWKKQFRELFVLLNSESARSEDILATLARGEFSGEKGGLLLPSSGILSDDLVLQFARSQKMSRGVRGYLKRGKRILDRLGIKIPESIKAELRKVF